MNKEEFFDHLSRTVGRPLSDLEVALLNNALEPAFIYSQATTEFIELENLEARVLKGSVGLWLYDVGTMICIINVPIGSHESLTRVLYGIYNNKDVFEADDLYVEQHYGFYVSGAMNMRIPIKADDYVLSAPEEIFNKIKGPHKWRQR